MAKKKSPDVRELPLFDLPLDGPAPLPPEAEQVPAPGSGAPEPESAAEPEGAVEPEGENLPLFNPEVQAPAAPPSRSTTTAAASPAETDEGEDAPARRAAIGERLHGGLVDLAIHIAVLGLAAVSARLMGVALSVEDWPPFILLGLVFSFLYWVIPLAFWGRTPGMTWAGQVARASNDEPLTFGQTALRWLAALLTVAGLGLPLLLALSGRSLSDRMSDSTTWQER